MTGRREKIAFVKSIKEFGENRLGLYFDGSFEKTSLENPTANWLYVARPDALESALPEEAVFMFFWNITKARRAATRYRKKGMHTYLYSAEAHGGRMCPITPSLLEADPCRQAYVVLHEGWHATLRAEKIRMPYALEEATGRVVGVAGAVEFAKFIRNSEMEKRAERQAAAWMELARFVNRSCKKLERAYGNNSPVKRLLGSLRKEAFLLRDKIESRWEKEELTREMNNAFFMRYRDYTLHYPLALRVWKKKGSLPAAMREYRRAATEGPLRYLRDKSK